MCKSIIGVVCICLAVISFNASAAIVQIDSSASIIHTSGGLFGSGYGDLSISGSFNLNQAPHSLEGWDALAFEDIDILISVSGFQSPSITSALPDYSVLYNGETFQSSVYCIFVVGVICPTDTITGSYDGTNFSMTRDYFSGYPDDFAYSIIINGTVSAVPVPAAVWLFGSGLIGLIGLARHNSDS